MQDNSTPARKKQLAKIQSFHPVDVMAWFSADSLKWEDSARFLAKLLHPKGPHCRQCGATFTDQRRSDRFYRFDRIQCPTCKAFSTAATGTIIHKSEFEPREIILLSVGLELGISDKAIAKLLSCSGETVRTWRIKFAALNEK